MIDSLNNLKYPTKNSNCMKKIHGKLKKKSKPWDTHRSSLLLFSVKQISDIRIDISSHKCTIISSPTEKNKGNLLIPPITRTIENKLTMLRTSKVNSRKSEIKNCMVSCCFLFICAFFLCIIRFADNAKYGKSMRNFNWLCVSASFVFKN